MRIPRTFVLLLTLCSGVVLRAGPVALVRQPFFCFDSVLAGQSVTHSFVGENTGDAPLRIKGTIIGRSDCMTVEPTEASVPPGGKVTFEASLCTHGMRGNVARGLVLETNDPENSRIELLLVGDVAASYVLKPHSVFFLGTVKQAVAQHWEFSFTPTALGECALTRVQVPEGFTVEEPPNRRASTHKLVLRSRGEGLNPGPIRDIVRLTTDSAEIPIFEIPLLGKVQGAITAFPLDVTSIEHTYEKKI